MGRISSAISDIVKQGVRGALDLLYPCQCRLCARLMQDRDGLCASCWSQVQYIERPYCEVLGIPFAIDHGEETLSALAIAQEPPFLKLRSAVIHEGVSRRFSQQLKYHDRGDLAPMMARWMIRANDGMLNECDAILAVPLHSGRLLTRRYNQSAELARQISLVSDKPFLAGALTRRKATKQQVGLTKRARQENVKAAFQVSNGFETAIAGKRLLLIDDVYTTGATVSSVSRTLKRAGAEAVYVLTFAMAISQPI